MKIRRALLLLVVMIVCTGFKANTQNIVQDIYSLSTIENALFLTGDNGIVKASKGANLVSIQLNANKSYQLRLSGSGTTFAFNGQEFTILDNDIVDIELSPTSDMTLLLSIKTDNRKENYSWVLLYNTQ